MGLKSFRTALFLGAAALGMEAASAILAPAYAQETTRTYAIEPQELDDALREFGRQTGRDILFAPDAVAGKRSPGVEGQMTERQALEALLAGTGLRFEQTASNGYAVQDPNSPTQLGDAQRGVTPSEAWVEDEEIVVVGTNIRGVAPVGAPLIVIDRDEIDRLGVGTAQEIVRTLPQNFNGGVGGEDRRFSAGGTPLNVSGGAGVNLRGLGGDSTLVLVNGRRLPQGASPSGQFVDVSSIPISAIERVEVLPDGASAIYGSDAIAGVINFVLRDDYEGAETRLRYGSVTDGSLDEYQASQVIGRNFDRGNLLVGYEYFHKNPLPSEERAFATNSDLTGLGGLNAGSSATNPANIDQVIFPNGSTQSVTFAVPGGQDGTNLQPGDLLSGVINRYNTNEGRWLLSKQERHSVFLTANFEARPSTDLYAEMRYTNRAFETRQSGETVTDIIVPSSNPFFVTPVAGASAVRIDYNMIDDLGPRRDVGDVETIFAVVGLTQNFGDDWTFDLYGSYGEETTSNTANVVHRARLEEALGVDNPNTPYNPAVDGYFNPFADGSNTPRGVLDYVQGFADSEQRIDLWTIRGELDGDLFTLPGGDFRVALGTEYREEGRETSRLAFDSTLEPTAAQGTSLGRSVLAAFGELYVPLFSEENARLGFRELVVSVAARYEEYSDFGSSTDPKIGVRWTPVSGLTFRGTYGTSYKAPLLTDYGDFYAAVIFPVVDPENTATGRTVALVLQGENSNLSAERSTSWTAGFDLVPAFAPGLRVEGTYFSLSFEDQIGMFSASPFSALQRPEIFGSVTTRDPDPALTQSLLDDADTVFDLSGGQPVAALVDARITNLAVTEISGFDLGVQYDVDTEIGIWSFGLSAGYLLEYDQASSAGDPLIEFIDTLYNPLDLRIRGSLNWSNGPLSASAFVNYADDYTNNTFSPAERIESWTTIDLQARYELSGLGPSVLEGISVALNVQNLFDEDPPFVIDANAASNVGLAYDSENADPLGRFVALQLTKTW